MSCVIIAEIGVNHNGDLALAKSLIDTAQQAGADVVKFQTFNADLLVTKTAKKASYQLQTTAETESQYQMLKRLELSKADHFHLLEYCQQLNIKFLSTPFDFESLDFLVNDLKLTQLKVSSGDLTNAPMLLAMAKSGCELIISSGMASLAEIKQALGVITFGLLQGNGVGLNKTPSLEHFSQAYQNIQGRELLKQQVTLLHCTTDYPAQPKDINLHAMQTLAVEFGLNVGYSDHSSGNVVPIAAVALGAKVIEKHITLDCNLPGPDHRASIEPSALVDLVRDIRLVELALGSREKKAAASEEKNKVVARKSLVAIKNIKQGEPLSKDNIAVKRPGNGMSPYHFWQVLNKPASGDYCEGDLINEPV